MKYSFKINNLKCGGCENTIKASLKGIAAIKNIHVDVEEGLIKFDSEDPNSLFLAKSKLAKLGYPENDPTYLDTAKSFASCIIGRLKSEV